jgi:hypothetical protein
MKRTLLVAAASVAPFLILAQTAGATDTISTTTTTPVATATATSGGPDNIDIAAGGAVNPTVAGAAVTLNSNNTVSSEGSISFTGVDGAVGVKVVGGDTGAVKSSGSISVSESYSAATDTNTGLLMGAFATGTNRIGIQVVGPGVFTGGVTNTGAITVHGQNSYAVSIEAPMTGDFQSIVVTPATSTAAAVVTTGSITVVGEQSAGFRIAPTGSVGGAVTLGSVSVTGTGARGVDIQGAVGGTVDLAGAVSATGYRTTTRSNYPTLADRYTAAELTQGGSAAVIAANVGGGVILSAPPLTAAATTTTTPPPTVLVGGASVPQSQQGTGTLTTYGSAPALLIGSLNTGIELGRVGANDTVTGEGGAGAYGLVNQGSISGNGVFDTLNYPNLAGPVSGNALQIGTSAGLATVIDGGVYNTGAITAQAYQANATAIHVLGGGATPLILNDGTISAAVTQENIATTGVTPLQVYGVLIERGANVPSFVNNGGVTANITGTGGVGGSTGGIIDRSGSLTTLTNTGTINAEATQTLITTPMPVALTAIDMSLGATAQTLTQSANPAFASTAGYSATSTYSQGAKVAYNGLVYQATTAVAISVDPQNYPTYWREIGAVSPFISGSVLMGSGGSTLNVTAGSVNAPVLNLGTGANNALVINGAAGSAASATIVTGAVEEVAGTTAQQQVAGASPIIGGGNGTLTISINNGTLNDINPNKETIRGVNVGANGVLLVSADPRNHANTQFITTGASTFANGAGLGLSLLSIPTAVTSTYTVLQTIPGQGTLSVGTLSNAAVAVAPWLFTTTASYVAAANPAVDPSLLQLTVTRKSAAQLGFNRAEASALDAVLAAAPGNAGIQSALLNRTTEAGLKPVYDQLLPSQGQGLFEALDAAAQAEGAMTGIAPSASSRVAGTSLWLQEVNERVDRTGAQTDGSFSKLLGVIGGVEHTGALGGAAGLTLAYFNANELDHASQIGTGVVASMVEAGGYYRRSMGRFTMSARAGAGYAWFSDHRVFVATNTVNGATTGTELRANSTWGGVFFDGHFGASYEQPFGRYYARPEVSADFLELNEGSHSDTGGGSAFDLTVARRNSNRLSGQALMVVGREWGQGSWLRTELRGGYREILAGQIGDTIANFTGGGAFTLSPENDKGGWMTAGFSIKGGSQYSYLALEGDADFRANEQRFDLRVAGRSIF